MYKILIVEDESSILELIKFNVKKEGYEVAEARDGHTALSYLKENKVDLVILDLMLPGIDGIEICKHIRQMYGFSVYVIMLTAKGEEIDKIVGLEVGADDYMTKPFSPRELLARIKAVFRRNNDKGVGERKLIEKGDLKIDKEQYYCEYKGVPLNLTPKQFSLLLYLVENSGKVCTREELLSKVWGYDYLGDSRTVDVHIRQLRQSLTDIDEENIPIETLRGVGYRFRSGK
jgi:two-component system alkaline phosphatase synthesis response regulator PhoP